MPESKLKKLKPYTEPNPQQPPISYKQTKEVKTLDIEKQTSGGVKVQRLLKHLKHARIQSAQVEQDEPEQPNALQEILD